MRRSFQHTNMKTYTSKSPACKEQSSVINTAHEIHKLHDDIVEAGRSVLDKAIRIGELLTKTKVSLKHGEWLPWLKANITFSQQTANKYMRCYSIREDLKLLPCSNLPELLVTQPTPQDAIALEPADFQRFNRLSPENRLIVETSLTIFHQQGRAVTPDDVVGLIDRLEVARN